MASNDSRFLLLLALFSAALLAVFAAGIMVGPAAIAPRQTAQVLLSGLSAHFDGLLSDDLRRWQHNIVWQVRMPRVLTGILVGAASAVSGAVLQGLFRNPLASSTVLGVSSGAAFGAVLALFLGLASVTVWALPAFAFVGAALSLALVCGIAMQRGQVPIATLLLAGIAVSAMNIALGSFVQALALERWEVGKSIVYWTMGGLDGRTWDHIMLIAPIAAISLLAISAYHRDLDLMLLGEIHASAVGVNVARVRWHLLLAVALLDSAAVAVSGGIGFIGLVVPHIVRLLIGPHHRYLLPLSAIAGAALLAGADLVLRYYFPAKDIPVGVVTAALGAPFFLWLLYRQRKASQW